MLKIKLFLNKAAAFVLILTFIFLSSCKGNSEENKNTAYFSFSDALGREIVLEEKPQRTAALLGSLGDIWLLGGGELVAAPSDLWEDFGYTSESCINIGGAHSPDAERVLFSEPDFIIASASTAKNVEMMDIFEKAGITIAYFDVDNFDDYLSVLKIFTGITGRSEFYEKNGVDIKKTVDENLLKSKIVQMSDDEKKVLLLRVSSGSVKAKGSKGTVLGEMLSHFGLINIADNEASLLENLSIESILENEPYRIFIVTMGSDTEIATENIKKLLEEDPLWSSLEAVKENRVYFTDKTLFNLKPNDRWGEAYEALYEILSK